jgi:deoxyribonuclease V
MELPDNRAEAKKIQLKLRKRVRIVPLRKHPACIAGVDAAFTKDRVIAAACLYTYPGLVHVEDAHATAHITMPYIPGFLSFREGPAMIKAINRLRRKPDLILFDGQGTAHPLGMGIAAHMGVLLNIPSVGCAKSRLVGSYSEPGNRKGQCSELIYQNKVMGAVIRTRDNVKPLFVSPGHLVDLNNAIEIVLNCTGKYSIPQPLRRADGILKELKKSAGF